MHRFLFPLVIFSWESVLMITVEAHAAQCRKENTITNPKSLLLVVPLGYLSFET